MTKDQTQQKQLANDFLALHHNSETFILPNAWDAMSAKMFEIEGFKAIGTTSAGVAATLGHADGQAMNVEENIQVVRRIVENCKVPVSADIEAGYGETIEEIVSSAQQVIECGAVGLNLEDSTGNPDKPMYDKFLQAEKIRAIREVANSCDIHLCINARTDSYLTEADPKTKLNDAIDRGNLYKEAGADCIFVPDVGDLDRKTIQVLVKEIDAPINVIAGPTIPSIEVLNEIGVSRVSLGPRPMRAVYSLLKDISNELKTTGTYKTMSETSITYAEVNSWFEK